MKILFTGGSSFTGLWFIRELTRAGHEVVATFRKRPEHYPDPLRQKRASLALEHCRAVFEVAFGEPRFIELAASERWDLLCHHGAEAANYRSADFDAAAALAANTRGLAAVLDVLRPHRTKLLLTGSVFENDEGAGSEGLPAFSAYGLSKGFTFQAWRYQAQRAGLPLGKFVIPNPFGPYEEARFTAYLMKTWAAGGRAAVNTPDYVRDNIHVSLLARAYAAYAEHGGPARVAPSGYVESQGAFARRYSAEMRARLGLPCELELKAQSQFDEPRVRINTDVPNARALGWDETQAWDEIAEYYRGVHGLKAG